MLLSLDIGFNATGYSVFENRQIIDIGVIRPERSKKKNIRTADETVMRAQILVNALRAVIDRNGVNGIIGELPSGGAQSARAMRDMASATCAIAGMIACLELPCEFCTPAEVKLAATGNRSASKGEIMDAIAHRYGWPKMIKTVITTISKGGVKEKTPVDHITYHVKTEAIEKHFAAGIFEHAADSVAAYHALSSANLVKIYG